MLFFEFLRVAKDIQPKTIVAENVKAVVVDDAVMTRLDNRTIALAAERCSSVNYLFSLRTSQHQMAAQHDQQRQSALDHPNGHASGTRKQIGFVTRQHHVFPQINGLTIQPVFESPSASKGEALKVGCAHEILHFVGGHRPRYPDADGS